jgi:hypothetical protein
MDQPLAFKSPNKNAVIKELDSFIGKWRAWEKEVDKLGSDPIDPFDPRPGRVHLDGEENRKKHTILQERTLAFLDKNLVGHHFISGKYGDGVDSVNLRLNIRVKHRLIDLDELRARIDYAEVPPGSFKKTALKIAGKSPDFISNLIVKLVQSGSGGT